ncbi:MAG: polysaccharide deacetylase family protein [Candidatus Eremiobacteraeota bacterium]|nr:polysaccharide deacetylase family protein [Candidatus Eremiobacteraeota bacterium]
MRDWVYANHRLAFWLGTVMVALGCLLFRRPSEALGVVLAGVLIEPMLIPQGRLWGRVQTHLPRPSGVALTFDDGPSEHTEELLDVLAALEVKATFFVIGSQVEKFPETARRITDEGHAIGNHTQNHPNLLLLPAGAVAAEIESANRVIERVTGVVPRLFRPPYGYRTPLVHRAVRRLGQTMVTWSLNPRDFLKPGLTTLVTRVLQDVQAGDIVLLHDGGKSDRADTVAAVPLLVRALRQRGLEPVPLEGANVGLEGS